MSRDSHPVLITDAPRSQDDQRHSREVRYLLMMSVRVVALILAAVLAAARAPMPWLWAPLCLAGMVIVPWLAVQVANDRPPKDEHRLPRNRHGAESDERAIRPGAESDQRAIRSDREPMVIDADK